MAHAHAIQTRALRGVIAIGLCLGLTTTVIAADLDTTMHPLPKPGTAASACPACAALEVDEHPIAHERARDRGAPEYAGSQREASADFDSDRASGPSGISGGAPISAGALVPGTAP